MRKSTASFLMLNVWILCSIFDFTRSYICKKLLKFRMQLKVTNNAKFYSYYFLCLENVQGDEEVGIFSDTAESKLPIYPTFPGVLQCLEI